MSKIDSWFADRLRSDNRLTSRRSFVSKMTAMVFGAMGVPIATRAFLEHRAAMAQGGGAPWNFCGLQGYQCDTGNCSSSVTGAVPGSSWNQCCLDPSCNRWVQCNYQDVCNDTAITYTRTGCSGPGPNSWTINWCNGAKTRYICTVVMCSGTGAKKKEDCIGGGEESCKWHRDCTDATTGAACWCKEDSTSSTGWRCVTGTSGEANP